MNLSCTIKLNEIVFKKWFFSLPHQWVVTASTLTSQSLLLRHSPPVAPICYSLIASHRTVSWHLGFHHWPGWSWCRGPVPRSGWVHRSSSWHSSTIRGPVDGKTETHERIFALIIITIIYIHAQAPARVLKRGPTSPTIYKRECVREAHKNHLDVARSLCGLAAFVERLLHTSSSIWHKVFPLRCCSQCVICSSFFCCNSSRKSEHPSSKREERGDKTCRYIKQKQHLQIERMGKKRWLSNKFYIPSS